MIKLRVSNDVALLRLHDIPHNTCREAIKNNWINTDDQVKAQSVCWLYCWAKTGQGSGRAKLEAMAVFDSIFEALTFKDFDTRPNALDWARKNRYKKVDIENALNDYLTPQHLKNNQTGKS